MVIPENLSPQPLSRITCFPFATGQQDEGICLRLEIGPYRILLDCGLQDISPLTEAPTLPGDYLICSHAHADHVRGLVHLHQAFPALPIAASETTARLLPLNWPGLPHHQTQFAQTLLWRSPTEILPQLFLELIPAGHLPGAALILLSYHTPQRTYRVLYTGDYCLSNLQMVNGLVLEPLRGLRPDVLILETQYGTRRLPHRRQQEKQFIQQLDTHLQAGHNILLPVPPLGVAQEMLKLLRTHHAFTGRAVNLWAAGTVITACDAYLAIIDALPDSVRNFTQHQPLFWDDKILPHLRPLTPENWQQADLLQERHIIVTDQWPSFWPDPEALPGNWSVFYPQQPATNVGVTLPDISPSLSQFSSEEYLLADHSDGRNATQLIHNLRPQHLVFVHGHPHEIGDLTSLSELQSRYQIHAPSAGTPLELPFGDRFLQPSPPTPSVYEGDIHDGAMDRPLPGQDPKIIFELENRLETDDRWQRFSETGLVEARWQGNELVLRGISQRELNQQHQSQKRLADLECCQNCHYYQFQHCNNEVSPLRGKQVRPEGCCPFFEETAT